jgi:hypothetical protein
MRFTIDVDYSTHDALKDGIIAVGFRRFVIDAPDADAATLIAAQWVAADRISGGVIPTRTYVCI